MAVNLNNSGVSKAKSTDEEGRSTALVDLQGALALYEDSGQSCHQDTAAICNNIGNMHYTNRTHGDALDMYQRALEIYEKLPPTNHLQLDVAATISNIGLVFECQGKYEEAMVHYSRALSIRAKFLGDHDDTLRSLRDCADAYEAQGQLCDDRHVQQTGASYRRRAGEMTDRMHPP